MPARPGNPYAIKVYASESSQIDSYNREPDSMDTFESVSNGLDSSSSNTDVEARIRSQFGALTSFSQISQANRISVKLSHSGKYYEYRPFVT